MVFEIFTMYRHMHVSFSFFFLSFSFLALMQSYSAGYWSIMQLDQLHLTILDQSVSRGERPSGKSSTTKNTNENEAPSKGSRDIVDENYIINLKEGIYARKGMGGSLIWRWIPYLDELFLILMTSKYEHCLQPM